MRAKLKGFGKKLDGLEVNVPDQVIDNRPERAKILKILRLKL